MIRTKRHSNTGAGAILGAMLLSSGIGIGSDLDTGLDSPDRLTSNTRPTRSIAQSDATAETKPKADDPPKSSLPQITIDGTFDDWAHVTPYIDAAEDTREAEPHQRYEIPRRVDNPDVDLLEYKISHDTENLYAYFRARGEIGKTQKVEQTNRPFRRSRGRSFDPTGRPGRFYAILAIDVDQSEETGYWLNEGGYHPPSTGYDVNAEIEWYNGQINTGHYLNHGARNENELFEAFLEQTQRKYIEGHDGPYPAGTITVLPGTYKYYTQWVYHADDTLTIVRDKGPAVPGIVRFALSNDQHELEIQFPYKGFLKDPSGKPIMALGQTLNISFSLESSGELSKSGRWASDTGSPIKQYTLTPPQ